MAEYFPILIYFVAALGVALFSAIAPHLIAPRKPTKIKDMPYESGMDPKGDARQPLDVRFYLIAILFLIFDVELLYLYPWAISIQGEDGLPRELRPLVLGVMLVLLVTLAIAYLVARRKGVFDWRRR